MLLSINENKVAELLRSSPPGFAVFTVGEPIVAENYSPIYRATSEAFGVVYSPPPLFVTAETREHLVSARRKIEESGVPLKNVDELTKEIDEMRGGGR